MVFGTGSGAVPKLRDITVEVAEVAGAEPAALAQRERETAAALREAMEDAKRANRAKSDFLSRMSHELRTPLNAVLGFGQLLELNDALDERDREAVEHILKAGSHLLELINEVLDLATIESGRMSISPEPVDISEQPARRST